MEPRDLLKKLHPKQFSDSIIIDKIEHPRELLDFSISRLFEQNMHFDFEEFARKLLEREVCPNLIEETGPGDTSFIFACNKLCLNKTHPSLLGVLISGLAVWIKCSSTIRIKKKSFMSLDANLL